MYVTTTQPSVRLLKVVFEGLFDTSKKDKSKLEDLRFSLHVKEVVVFARIGQGPSGTGIRVVSSRVDAGSSGRVAR